MLTMADFELPSDVDDLELPDMITTDSVEDNHGVREPAAMCVAKRPAAAPVDVQKKKTQRVKDRESNSWSHTLDIHEFIVFGNLFCSSGFDCIENM